MLSGMPVELRMRSSIASTRHSPGCVQTNWGWAERGGRTGDLGLERTRILGVVKDDVPEMDLSPGHFGGEVSHRREEQGGPLKVAGDVPRFGRDFHHEDGVGGSERADERRIQIELVAEDYGKTCPGGLGR